MNDPKNKFGTLKKILIPPLHTPLCYTGCIKKNATPIFLYISIRINATVMCLNVQKGDVILFVLHIGTGLSDKWLRRYRQNRFTTRILKFSFNGIEMKNLHLIFFFSGYKIYRLYDITRLVNIILIRLGYEIKLFIKNQGMIKDR